MMGGGKSDLAPTAVKIFSAGSAGCMADLVTFPLDTAKVRLQVQGESEALLKGEKPKYRGVFGTIIPIVRNEGPKNLYNGLLAGLHRQMCFSSIRIGLYDTMKQLYANGSETHVFNWLAKKNQACLNLVKPPGKFKVLDVYSLHETLTAYLKPALPTAMNCCVTDPGLRTRLLAGCTTGAMAVTFAQPTDVVKVRFQAQIHRPENGSVKRYSSTTDAYRTIARDEGLRGLWKGCVLNITRNAIVNCSELVTYDIIKEQILKIKLMTDNMPCHFTAAFAAGFCTTIVASPVDVVKTRFMNSVPGQYSGAVKCALTMLLQEGPSAFYKGFMASFLRLGSWNIVMFVSYEQIQRAVIRFQRSWGSRVRTS